MVITQRVAEKPKGTTATIQLTHGKEAIVDADKYEWLNSWKWKAQKSKSCWYAVRTVTHLGIERQIKMHRAIMFPREDEDVHHLNLNPLDNRVENLINCTPKQHKQFHRDFG